MRTLPTNKKAKTPKGEGYGYGRIGALPTTMEAKARGNEAFGD
jgi:hypothetical protein